MRKLIILTCLVWTSITGIAQPKISSHLNSSPTVQLALSDDCCKGCEINDKIINESNIRDCFRPSCPENRILYCKSMSALIGKPKGGNTCQPVGDCPQLIIPELGIIPIRLVDVRVNYTYLYILDEKGHSMIEAKSLGVKTFKKILKKNRDIKYFEPFGFSLKDKIALMEYNLKPYYKTYTGEVTLIEEQWIEGKLAGVYKMKYKKFILDNSLKFTTPNKVSKEFKELANKYR